MLQTIVVPTKHLVTALYGVSNVGQGLKSVIRHIPSHMKDLIKSYASMTS